MPANEQQHELPFLAGIAGVLRWVEELTNILSGPLLVAGLAIALVDLLTDGALLAVQPELLYAWAVSQAIGVDAQLVAAWDKARQALRTRRYWSLIGLVILGVALAYVGYLAAVVFAMQQSAGISTAEALGRLGMDSATWLVSRAALSVVLVCLSGWTRYHPPAKSRASLEDERAAIERELTLEPLRAELRQRKAVGWRTLAGTIIQPNAATARETPHMCAHDAAGAIENKLATSSPARTAPAPLQRDSDRPPDRPPTGDSIPAQQPVAIRTRRKEAAPDIIQLTLDRPVRRTEAHGQAKKGANPQSPRRVRTATVEATVRAVWRPGMSVGQLERAAGVSRNAAGKWRKVLLAEAQAEDGRGQQAVR